MQSLWHPGNLEIETANDHIPPYGGTEADALRCRECWNHPRQGQRTRNTASDHPALRYAMLALESVGYI